VAQRPRRPRAPARLQRAGRPERLADTEPAAGRTVPPRRSGRPGPGERMIALDVAGLRSGYGRAEVLHGVDLRVPAGKAVALLGSNGAGKTTLLKTIAGLLPAREGHVRFQGSPVERRPANARARAGLCLIPEGRGIFRRL